MHRILKRLLALLLALLMCVSLFPVTALAEGPVGAPQVAPGDELPNEPEAPGDEAPGGGEDGDESPVEVDIPGVPDDGLTPAAEDIGDDALGVPLDDPDALPPEGDEPEDVTASGSCGGNLTWTLENGVLTISGFGTMDNGAPWYDYRESITSIVLPQGLTSIGNGAFFQCKNLSSVTIPEGVITIGSSAFCQCSSLVQVNIPSTVVLIEDGAFMECSALVSVFIPENVTLGDQFGNGVFSCCFALSTVEISSGVAIGGRAFEKCQGLRTVTISSGVASIGEKAFNECYNVQAVYIDDLDWWLNLTVHSGEDLPHGDLYVNGVLLEEIDVPEGMESIRDGMFQGCKSLRRIGIPDSVVNIGEGAFEGCSRLSSLVLPEGLSTLSSRLFLGCSALTNIEIPAGVSSIGSAAFYRCTNLTSIDIPVGVVAIGGGAFTDCSSLTTVTIPSSVEDIGAGAFWQCSGVQRVNIDDLDWWLYLSNTEEGDLPQGDLYVNGVLQEEISLYSDIQFLRPAMFANCRSLKAVALPAGLITIPKSAFEGCSSLLSVTIPDGVYNIENSAFRNCSALTSVYMPENLTDIGFAAFEGCDSLTDLEIPESVVRIGDRAFNSCRSLTNVKIPVGVTSIGSSAFHYCSSLTSVTIPEGVTSIGGSAFFDCGSLSYVSLPESLTTIKDDAFNVCPMLEDVLYAGTEEQRYSISIDNGNNCLTNALWHYGKTAADIVPCSLEVGENGSASVKIAIRGETLRLTVSPDFGYVCRVVINGEEADPENYTVGDVDSLVIQVNFQSVKPGHTVMDGGQCGSELYWILFDGGLLYIFGTGEMDNWNQYNNHAPWWYSLNGEVRTIETIELEPGLSSIGSKAFDGCSGLTNVTIPESVTSIGDVAFSGCSGLTNVTIPESVTAINQSVFAYCFSLKSVTIPAGVTDIGSSSFAGCSSLSTFDVPEGVTRIGKWAFSGCSGLKTIVFNGDAPAIEEGCFSKDMYDGNYFYVNTTAFYPIDNETWTEDKLVNYGAQRLTWVGYRDVAAAYTVHFNANGGENAPDDQIKGHGVDLILSSGKPTRVGFIFLGWNTDPEAEEAAYASSAAFSTDADTTLYAIWQELKPGEILVDGGVCGPDLNWAFYQGGLLQLFGSGAMYDWNNDSDVPWYSCRENITDIVLPDGLTNIGNNAFRGCKYVQSVTIPSTMTSIGDWVFAGCSSLGSVEIPERVTCIGKAAFRDCSSLSSVTIPSTMTSIGDWVFAGCSSLGSVEIPESVTGIGEYAFTDCSSLTEVTIPSSVTSIGLNAFYNCGAIQAVYIDDLSWWLGLSDSNGSTLPHGDLYLNGEAVTEIIVPSGTLGLRPSMFQNMTSLTAVILPDNLRSIGDYAFQGCSSLSSVTISESVTDIGYRAFAGCSGLKTICFSGNAPLINSSAFKFLYIYSNNDYQYINATALYPIDNETWTADKLQNYGAQRLTWVGYRDVAAAYTVHFNANGGENAPDDQIKGHGVVLILSSESPSREGYSFAGWAADPEASEAVYAISAAYGENADIELYAVWTIKTYPVSFDANGGEGAPETQTKTYGVELTLSETIPVREGYVFLGWSTSPSSEVPEYQPGESYVGNGGLLLYAVWQAETYAVHFNLNGGYSYNGYGELTKTYGEDLYLNCTPLRTGHEFLGWARDPEATSPEYQPLGYYYDNEPVTLYAVWKVFTFPVIYVTGKGVQAPANQVKTWGEDLVLGDTVPEAEGYIFLGWSLNNQSNLPDYQPGETYTGNGSGQDGDPIYFYAVWQLKTYLVTYRANGGDGGPVAQIKFHGRPLTLSSDVPVREGYRFLGWATTPDAAEAAYQPGASFTLNADTNFYAVWEEEEPVVIADYNLALSNTEGFAGREFTVDLTMDENPGVMMISFKLDYDKSVLEFLGGQDGALGGWLFLPVRGSASWDDDQDHTETGVLATLRFRVRDDVQVNSTEIRITELFVGNYNEEELSFGTIPATVTISRRVAGDVTGDGKVNGIDLIRLRKYLAGDDVEINFTNADVNGDGKISGLDLIRLRKYLAGDDVTLD